HAGAAAGLFAMGQGELPADQVELWKKLLEVTCAKNRSAPAAAKRMGMAPPWPPALPDAFNPLIQEAEKKSANVVAADAANNPAFLKKSPALPTGPKPPRPAAQKAPPAPPDRTAAEPSPDAKKEAPAIRRSP